MARNSNIIIVRVHNKRRTFSRTEKYWFDITDCLPDSNWVLGKARLVSDECVADLYSKILKGKASKLRKLRTKKKKTVNLGDNIRGYSSGGSLT